jgi:hypothetical protein
VKQVLDFLRRQTRRWLIEDNDPGVPPHGASDLDHLALSGAELLHQNRWIDVEVQRLKRAASRTVSDMSNTLLAMESDIRLRALICDPYVNGRT